MSAKGTDGIGSAGCALVKLALLSALNGFPAIANQASFGN
ncbi:hypothetical protein swp_3576 [Shewanella piezotolerans WP3]|uniref:Uncharacterized protein n=1 Tax=Shewanella piezotolerans (strain WP3 / JCM 13877) TaxID=225849 RepID=B8CQD8_SHEPW|nr:hypothetical protein swp_3576 [Shewanella piezotolerans WP3]